MTTDERGWAERAASAQQALGATGSAGFGRRFVHGAYRNTSRPRLRQAFPLNYWWIAHVIEVRIDGFERSGDARLLEEARLTYARLVRRNHGRLENDYFDDMGWLAIAALRLHDAEVSTTGGSRSRYLDDAVQLQRYIAARGWNDSEGPSVSWRVQQPAYKNAPSNGAFAIVSARLADRTGDAAYRGQAEAAAQWMRERLLRPDHLVADGVNRLGDGRTDTDWLFTYNQGLYVGALVELAAGSDGAGSRSDRPGSDLADSAGDPLREATATALAAIRHFAPPPARVVTGENADLRARGGGDLGLFKGILVRYLGLLAAHLPDGPERAEVVRFLRDTTDTLWTGIRGTPGLRAADDWSQPAPPVTFLSTQLSAVMALETRARLEAGSVPRDNPHREGE
ncbi:glycoside hydrolase family 76 protein [Herbiconiux solani]|uniref:glycoside hydrolase family 76 protein n=1 Tax=Herbiconiux solani TaxID=661329 RepID=UPI00082408AD|nr:glycoside hydrolase family 76 protein [Herbiconiux solani]